jgi:hypothetical protein
MFWIDGKQKSPPIYEAGFKKNYGWMGNKNPHRLGWGLKSSEIKIWRT